MFPFDVPDASVPWLLIVRAVVGLGRTENFAFGLDLILNGLERALAAQ